VGVSLSTAFTQANGVPAQIAGGPAWEVISGVAPTVSSNELLFSTAGTSNPIYGITVGLRMNGKNDVDVSMTPRHVYGNALYVRVVDASNWIRARLHSSSSSYTEYEYSDREWADRYEPRDNQPQWQEAITEYSYYRTTYQYTWSGWSNTGETTACRIDAPTYGLATVYDSWGIPVTEYRWVSNGLGVGCAADKATYRKQSRTNTRSSTGTTLEWHTSQPADNAYNSYSATGSSRVTASGGTYYAWSSNGGSDYQTGLTRVWATGAPLYFKQHPSQGGRTSPGQQTTPNGALDGYMDTSAQAYGSNYWATAPEAGGPLDPATGNSRLAYTYTYGYLTLEKCVAGTITNLGEYYSGSSTPYVIRIRAKDSTLEVYYNGTLRISATDATHVAGTKIGVGGGTSTYNQTMAQVDDFAYTILTPYRVRNAADTAWINVERPKIRNAANTAWIDYDPRLET
jgi:hypothetical protein